MKNSYEFYFAYGSNLLKKQIKRRCPSSITLCKASKENARLCFPVRSKMRENMGVASIKFEKGSTVEGIIYQLTPEDLENLDKYEGNGKRYRRKKIFVRLNDRSKKLVWSYLALSDSPNEFRPSDNYLGLIIKGAKEHNLTKGYIENIKKSAESLDL